MALNRSNNIDRLEIWDLGGGCIFWPQQFKVFRNGDGNVLTEQHRDFLLLLVRNSSSVLSYEQIIESVWSREYVNYSAVQQTKSRLCDVLGATGCDFCRFVEPLRRWGYKIGAFRRFNSAEAQSFVDVHGPAVKQSLSRYWIVPFRRNPGFTGREAILQQLHSQLKGLHRFSIFHIGALVGLGGVGKTQVALEYAFRHCEEYACVFWVSAETQSSLAADFMGIARAIGIPCEHIGAEGVREAVLASLAASSGSLIIFDNVDELDFVSRYIPQHPNINVIITTRRHTLQALGVLEPIEVDVFNDDEAVSFLLNRAAPIEDGSRQFAREISKRLGNLPVALEQVGGYISEQRISLEAYLALLSQHGVELLSDHPPVLGTYSYGVNEIWKANVAAINARPKSSFLLRHTAFLYADEIETELLSELMAKSANGKAANRRELEALLKPLLGHSIVRRTTQDNIHIHRLVQEMIKNQLSDIVRIQTIGHILKTLDRLIPAPTFPVSSHIPRFVTHILAMTEPLGEYANVLSNQAFSILLKSGTYLVNAGALVDAERILALAHRAAPSALGKARVLVQQGIVFRLQSRLDIAEQAISSAVKILSSRKQIQPYILLDAFNQAALIHDDKKEYSMAMKVFKRAQRVCKPKLSRDDPRWLRLEANTALVMMNQGKYADAAVSFRHVRDRFVASLGTQHVYIGDLSNNLGYCHFKSGQIDDAIKELQQAEEIYSALLPQVHRYRANTLENLADTLRVAGKATLADKYDTLARAIRESLQYQAKSAQPVNTLLT